MNYITLNCSHCQAEFLKLEKTYKNSLRTKADSKFYCSSKCQWDSQITRVKVNCKNCNIEFEKVQSQIKRTKNHFCSRSCGAIYNNTISPKRSHNNSCRICGKRTEKSKAVYCDGCRPNHCLIPCSEKTIGDIKKNQQQGKYSPIRNHARNLMKNFPMVCKLCGYSKHVECCHIKAISEFSDDTKLSIVNSLENLILLCRNCHWEFDHGIVKITPVGN
jgi:hypothetical protein